MIFSCGDVDEIKKLEDRIAELENKKENKDEGSFSKVITLEMIDDEYTEKGDFKNKRVSAFSSYVVSDIDINDGKKILCFFDSGSEHCEDAAKSLTQLSNSISNFPEMHIIFSDLEEDRIPEFFRYAGRKYSYQVLPFYNDDDKINSYIEILGYQYGNPAVIYLEDGNQMRFYDGIGANAFKAMEFKKLFE